MTDARDRTIGTMLHSQHKQERELVLLREAASAMLAALKVAWHEMRHTTATRSSFTDALDAVDAAIAQAEAAGIKVAS